jgi:Flp pilus assembly CpaE family ATPase
MPDRLRILVVGGDSRLAEEVRQCATEGGSQVAVQWLPDAAVALARLGGGDIDMLVIDSSRLGDSHDGAQDLFERLRAASTRMPVILPLIDVSKSRDWAADLRRMVATRLQQTDSPGARSLSQPNRGPKLIGFIGAKGGVGTTTVALSAAFALAEKHATLLAELGSGNDTLKRRIRTTTKSACIPGAALTCLWAVKDIPRLRVALAQDILVPEMVTGELEAIGPEADYLVLDLGSAVTPLVKTILPRLHALGVVVDLEMLSLECARQALDAVGQSDLCPHGSVGIVVVNRASLACPFSMDDVQRLVGIPVLGAIPSAADLCSAAQKARRPVIAFDPESLAAQSLARAALSFAELT